MWADGAEDIDPETGYATIRSNAQNRYVPNFSYGKGKIVWNFESVNMPAGTDGFLSGRSSVFEPVPRREPR